MSKHRFQKFVTEVELNRRSILNNIRALSGNISDTCTLTEAVSYNNALITNRSKNPQWDDGSSAEKSIEVRFFNIDGSIIYKYHINPGETVSPPVSWEFDNRLEFVEWQSAIGNTFENIQHDIDYVARYKTKDGYDYIDIVLDDPDDLMVTVPIEQYIVSAANLKTFLGTDAGFIIDWGDGTESDLITNSNQSSWIEYTHTYENVGEYTITFKINYPNNERIMYKEDSYTYACFRLNPLFIIPRIAEYSTDDNVIYNSLKNLKKLKNVFCSSTVFGYKSTGASSSNNSQCTFSSNFLKIFSSCASDFLINFNSYNIIKYTFSDANYVDLLVILGKFIYIPDNYCASYNCTETSLGGWKEKTLYIPNNIDNIIFGKTCNLRSNGPFAINPVAHSQIWNMTKLIFPSSLYWGTSNNSTYSGLAIEIPIHGCNNLEKIICLHGDHRLSVTNSSFNLNFLKNITLEYYCDNGYSNGVAADKFREHIKNIKLPTSFKSINWSYIPNCTHKIDLSACANYNLTISDKNNLETIIWPYNIDINVDIRYCYNLDLFTMLDLINKLNDLSDSSSKIVYLPYLFKVKYLNTKVFLNNGIYEVSDNIEAEPLLDIFTHKNWTVSFI